MSIEFSWNPKKKAIFYRTKFCVNWFGILDHLKKDIFKLYVFSAAFGTKFRLELLFISVTINIWLIFTNIHRFELLVHGVFRVFISRVNLFCLSISLANGDIVVKVFLKQLNFKGLKDSLEFWKKIYKWILLVKSIYSVKLNNIIPDYHKLFHSIVKMKLNTFLTLNDS